jgi:hypothetical protein
MDDEAIRQQVRHHQDLFAYGTPEPDVVEVLTGGPVSGVLSGVLLDHTTVDLMSDFTRPGPGDARLRKQGLASVSHAVSTVVESLVLHDRVLVGDGSELDGGTLLGSASALRPRALFWLLSVARRHALRIAADDRALDAAFTTPVDPAVVRAAIGALTATDLGPSLSGLLKRQGASGDELRDMMVAMTGRTLRSSLRRPEVYFDAAAFGRGQEPDIAALSRFAGLALARATFYVLLADRLGCVYRADALRANLPGVAVVGSFRASVLRELERQEQARDAAVNEALRFEALPLSLPLIANAVIQRAGTRPDCLRIALDVRESRQARRFRAFCRTVETAVGEGDRPGLERALADLRRYGIALTESVGAPGPAAELPTELLSYASPLASALFATFRIPAVQLADQFRNRRFALLTEVRNSQRGAVAEHHLARLWQTIPTT